MIANHDPKPLSAAVAQKLTDGGYADYVRKHPIATMDAPSSAVLTQWAKGAPNGLVNPEGKRKGVKNTDNHSGYGLRNDEKPFAHKIPPGGNWRNLSYEDKLIYWNGKIPTEGGSTNGLRRSTARRLTRYWSGLTRLAMR